jgi:hypothetical protein
MTRYQATIRHHSISAPIVDAGDTLHQAKVTATHHFGSGDVDAEIIIIDSGGLRCSGNNNIVARRRIGDARWTKC